MRKSSLVASLLLRLWCVEQVAADGSGGMRCSQSESYEARPINFRASLLVLVGRLGNDPKRLTLCFHIRMSKQYQNQ